MSYDTGSPAGDPSEPPTGQAALPLIIATMLREEGTTGVHTHVRQLRRYLADRGITVPVITPFSLGWPLSAPVFGLRFALAPFSKAAGVAWYRRWHSRFLRVALRRALRTAGECVIYAQGPPDALAALRARRGPHQRVAMAVHFRISQADEWADKGHIGRGGATFLAIRQLEREVIGEVDGLVYVSRWAREALVSWLPEAATVPYAIISNFVDPAPSAASQPPLADLITIGHLEPVKNHRYLLQVLAEARVAGRRLTLDVYGEGPLASELGRLCRSLDLQGQVRFRGFRHDVRDLLPRYRAYAHVSYSESSSLAIIEAMAAGLPILAAKIGPIPELCDDGAEARFWPLDDAAKAADILLDLLDSGAAREAAAAASARFSRDFDAAVVAPRLQGFLLGLPPGPRACEPLAVSAPSRRGRGRTTRRRRPTPASAAVSRE